VLNSPIELRQLQLFLQLAEELNFSRAARNASISQSSMTTQLQRLEDVLGVHLVDRNRHSVRLTAAGEALQTEARGLLDQIRLLVERTREAAGNVRPTLRIGYSEMAISSPMPKIIQEFRRQHPETETLLVEQSSNGSEKALLKGAVDCLFVPTLRANSQLSNLTIGEEIILVCIPETSDLARCAAVQIAQLQACNIILPDEGSRFSQRIARAFAEADVQLKVSTRLSRVSAMLTLVAAEAGICFIPLSLAGLVPDGVVTRPVAPPALTVSFSLVWLRESRNLIVEHFVSIARRLTVGEAS
jgi:LysR family transcriptional regulator, benzoate and cis,cis-muconate-responsive activator of ben and cat genes